MKFDISKQSKEYFQEIIYMHVFLHAIAKNPKKIIYVANRYAVVSAILSRLTQKAAKLKKQDDWTIEEDQRKSMFHED